MPINEDKRGRAVAAAWDPYCEGIDSIDNAADTLAEMVNQNTPLSASVPANEVVFRGPYNFFENEDIQLPVYRWDGRLPVPFSCLCEEDQEVLSGSESGTSHETPIFDAGFGTRPQEIVSKKNEIENGLQFDPPDNEYYNVVHHVNKGGLPGSSQGRNKERKSGFVSTTESEVYFPQSYKKKYMFRYQIYAPGGVGVRDTLGSTYAYPNQNEISFVEYIAAPYIRSAQLFFLSYENTPKNVSNVIYLNRRFDPLPYTEKAELESAVDEENPDLIQRFWP